MTTDEWKLWAEELNRVHKQYIAATRAYEQTLRSAQRGKLPKEIVPRAIAAALDSVRLCREQAEDTRRAILKKLK